MPAASRSQPSAQFPALPPALRSRRRGPAVSRRFGLDQRRDLATPASRSRGDLLLPAGSGVQAVDPGHDVITVSGGDAGEWRVHSQRALRGEPLPAARRLSVAGSAALVPGSVWSNTWSNLWQLRGVARDPAACQDRPRALATIDHPTGALQAMIIAIRRNAAWWALTPDERCAVLESSPLQIAASHMPHSLPGVASRLLDCRDLGSPQPFDALHWFEHAADGAGAVDDLLAAWRASPDWAYVDRDVDLRLLRD